jgi:prophage regulatory protein
VQSLQTDPLPPRQDKSSTLFLRMHSVIKITGLGRSTIYRLMAIHEFPCPVRLTSRAVAWRSSDIDAWSEKRPVVAH